MASSSMVPTVARLPTGAHRSGRPVVDSRTRDWGSLMRVVPVSDALGVQLSDFDIARPCSPAEQSELRELFCRHHLLLVRGQQLTAGDQTRFVGYFGPLHTRADGMTE